MGPRRHRVADPALSLTEISRLALQIHMAASSMDNEVNELRCTE